MRLKEDFVLRQVVENWVVLPLGTENVDFNGMLTLNESGALLWRALEQGGQREDLARALTGEYNVGWDEALADVDAFLEKIKGFGCLE